MNIHELDAYDLGDAVKFNDQLNPRLFDKNEKLRPEVREQLLRIADDFGQFLGVNDLAIKDITISGSNAAYTYTDHSDIDLHLVVDLPEADSSEVYRELFDAKKYAYNDMHDIRIGGYDVELYVQDANKTHHSQGIYSVKNNDWVAVPKRRRPDVDDISVKSKFEDLGHRIERIIATGDYERISALADKIKEYRQAGLDAHGEFGPENLAFKILRTQGLIKKLYDARNEAKDQLLSLDERRKKKKKVKYGYGGYWYPGTAYAGQDHPAGTEGGGDGGGGDGGESLREDQGTSDEDILRDFIDFCVKELKIEQMPRVKLRRDPQWPAVHKTFGRYNDESKTLEVAWGQRHIMDVLRTVAHELTHKHQHEREGERMGPDAGETGSPYENEANARAGVLMRDYGRLHPEYFTVGQAHDLEEGWKQNVAAGVLGATMALGAVNPARAEFANITPAQLQQLNQRAELAEKYMEALLQRAKEDGRPIDTRMMNAIKAKASDMAAAQIQKQSGGQQQTHPQSNFPKQGSEQMVSPNFGKFEESASGYIPTKAQAKDPRYSMALTVDIKPGQVGKEANKLKLKTDRQGHPQIARANGLFENLYKEYRKYKAAEDYDPDHPPGPEFKPTMPAGTLRVDVSDVYDWYKLGQHISNLKGLGRHDFGAGPPSAIVSFGDEDTEHEFIGDIEATGLDVTDIDPADPKKRPGRKIKTDPTYNVDEAIQAPVSKEQRAAEDYYRFIVGKIKLGRVLNRQEQEFFKTYNLKKKLAETAQSESEQHHGWRAELVDEITPTTFEVQVTNKRSRESANFVVRPVDMIRPGLAGKFSIDSMDLKDLQTGATRSIQSDSDEPWVYILDAVSALFWDTPALQARLQAQIKAHQDQGLPMLPGVKQRRSAGQSMPVKDFVKGQQAARDAISRAQSKKDINEDEDLDEVKMSPSALEKFATSPEAKGIRAGFEAELIFRDTQGEADEMDPEPDYDADERAYSIQQVIEFFDNDEYGYGLSDRGRRRLEDELDETYMNWRDEQMISDFRNEAEDLVRKVIEDEEWDWDDAVRNQLDDMGLSDDEIEEAIEAGNKAPRFTKLSDQDTYAQENPGYQRYLEAYSAAESILDDLVEESVKEQDKYWDAALDDFRDNYSGDDDSFFSDVGLRWMSDIANEFNLDWPVWNMDAGRNQGSRDWETIGALLQDAVDMPVKVSSNYHSTARREGQWIIEPDGSLSPDDPDDEAGLEIVSPPMPLLTAIEKLKAVVDWANNPKTGNAYTNSSTGLHMGVSLPRMKSEAVSDDIGIDYVKLILFLGDKYVLQQFGRTANTYTASALDKLKQNIKGKKSDPAGVVKLLQHGLTELAYKELQKGVGTSKYTSAHIQPGYIEFRSPGGDWLAKADEEIGVLENTMLRFARAMAIAGDPNAERQEYAKKLYKLVTEDNPEYADQLKLFSEFSAGTINKEQLKKQWADTVLQKELPSVGKEEYEVYRRDNGNSPDATVGTLYAKDYDDAYDQFLRQYGRDINDLDVRIKQPWFDVFDEAGRVVKTLRAKDIDSATDRAQYEFGQQWTDAWNIYRRPDDTPEPKASPRAQVAKRIAQPKPKAVGDDDASDWEAVYKPTGRVFDTLSHADTAQALAWRDIVMRSHGFTNVGDILVRRVGHQQAADARRDSADLQRNLGVQDVDIDVTQNFDPSAYERNSDRIDAIRAQSQQPRQNYELVQHDDTDRVIHRMPNATADEVRAWIAQQEAGGMPAGFLRTRIVAESTGQHDDEQTRTALDMAAVDFNYKNWADVEMRGSDDIKTAIQRHAVTKLDLAQRKPFNMLGKSRSAIVKGVAQADRELIDKQISTARKLGDDVNENFADKKVSGKSRPGRVKRAGASCKGSVTDLRARAKKYGGEKGKMYHWCANMKSGRKK